MPGSRRTQRSRAAKLMMGSVKPAVVAACQHAPLRSVVCWRVHPLKAGRRIALTFDDGPHPEHTHAVLDVLRARSVRGTFFVIGKYVEQYPDILRRVVDEGHDVGIHCYVHNNDEMPAQIRRTAELLAPFGIRTSLFRPPKGVLAIRTQLWTALHGMTTVLWSVDCRDSMRYEGKASATDDLSAVRSGDIVLLHDDNPLCAQDLVRVLDHADENRLSPVPVSQLLHG